MSTPSERIRAMVSGGRVDQAEGERMLRAIAAPEAGAVKSASVARLLVDPFERWGGGVAAIAGAVFVLAALAVSRLGVRFDGFLDLHVGGVSSSPLLAVVEQVAAWPIGAATLWIVARVLGGPGRRFLDFLGAVGAARGPLALFALPISALAPALPTLHMSASLLFMIAIAFVCIAWQVALLFFGYRNASGLRGPRLGFSFVGALFAAEIVSKLVLHVAKL
jgi:hypothetical protein